MADEDQRPASPEPEPPPPPPNYEEHRSTEVGPGAPSAYEVWRFSHEFDPDTWLTKSDR